MTRRNRRENIALAFQAVRRELENARVLLEAGGFSGSVGHAYYAAFHAARALLLSVEEEPGRHSGLQTRLSFHFVRTGRLAPEAGHSLAVLFAWRQQATYDPAAVFTERTAREALEEARGFVEAARAVLEEAGWLQG